MFKNKCLLHLVTIFILISKVLIAVVLFTGLRLLGIGRNQYIDLMNATKSNRSVVVSTFIVLPICFCN